MSLSQTRIDDAIKWQTIWGDNSDLTNDERGIISFSRMVFPDHVKDEYGVSEVHRHIYNDMFMLYCSKYRFLVERQQQIIVHREGAKSTVVLGVFLPYIICFNGKEITLPNGEKVTINEDMIAVCSETNTFATNWTRRARGSLSRKFIKHVFGNMKDENVRGEDGKWQEGAFKVVRDKLPYPFTGKNVSVIARGVGQQIRGINDDGRITLALIDDIYSKNNITTPESRQKVRYWFTAETKNSIDKNLGKIVCIGTVVHDDTVIIENKNSTFWRTIEYPVMDVSKFHEVLDKHCKIDLDRRTWELPNSGECEELEKQGFTTYWPEKFSLEMLLLMYAEALEGKENKTLSYFYQEYFHETIAEADKKIKAEMMRVDDFDFELSSVNGTNYTFVRMSNGEHRQVNTVISIDGAWSFESVADDSAIGWIGMDYNARVYLHSVISGKFGINDEFYNEEDYKNYASKLCEDRTRIKRIGVADEIFRMAIGHRTILVVEINTGAVEIARAINRKMTLYGRRFVLIEVTQHKNKAQRILDILTPYYQSRAVYHRPGQTTIMKQLELIQSTKHDDEADMFANGVANLQKPSYEVIWQDPNNQVIRKPKDNFFTRLKNQTTANSARSFWKSR